MAGHTVIHCYLQQFYPDQINKICVDMRANDTIFMYICIIIQFTFSLLNTELLLLIWLQQIFSYSDDFFETVTFGYCIAGYFP